MQGAAQERDQKCLQLEGRTTEHLISQTSGRDLILGSPVGESPRKPSLRLRLGLEWIRPHIDLCQRH